MAQSLSASYNARRDLAILKKDGIKDNFIYHPRHIPTERLIRDEDGNITWKGVACATLLSATAIGLGMKTVMAKYGQTERERGRADFEINDISELIELCKSF